MFQSWTLQKKTHKILSILIWKTWLPQILLLPVTKTVSLQHCQNLWCRSYHMGDPDVKNKSVTGSYMHPWKNCECDTECRVWFNWLWWSQSPFPWELEQAVMGNSTIQSCQNFYYDVIICQPIWNYSIFPNFRISVCLWSLIKKPPLGGCLGFYFFVFFFLIFDLFWAVNILKSCFLIFCI